MGASWTETCVEPEPAPTDRQIEAAKRRSGDSPKSPLYTDIESDDAGDDEKYTEPVEGESVRVLREELQSAKTELETMQAAFAKINVGDDDNPSDEKAKLAQQLEQASTRYNELVSSQKALNDEHQRQIAQFADRFSSLQQQLDAAIKAQNEEKQKSAQYDMMNAAIKEQNRGITSIMDQYKELHQVQLDTVQKEKDLMQRENQRLTDLLTSTQSENESLKNKVSESESVGKELEMAKEALQRVQTQFQRMKEESDLKQSLLTEQHRAEQEENTKLNDKLQNTLTVKMYKESTARYDAVFSAHKEADQRYEKQMAESQSTSDQLKQQLDAMTESKGNDEEKLSEYQSLCDSLQQQNVDLQQQMEEHRQLQLSQMAELQKEKEEMNEAANTLGEENRNLMERLSELAVQSEVLRKRVDEQDETERVKQEERNRMKTQLEQSSAKYLESENYHNLVQKQYEMEIAEYKAQSESLQQQLEQMTESEAMDEEDLNEYKAIITTLQQQNAKLEEKVGSILKAQKSQMESLQNEKEDLKAMTMTLSEEKAAMALKVEERDRKIETMKSKIAEYVAAEEATKKELVEKRTKLQESTARYDAVLSAHKEADERYEKQIAESQATSAQLKQQLDAMLESKGNDEEKQSEYQSLCDSLQQQNVELQQQMEEYRQLQLSQMAELQKEKEEMNEAANSLGEENQNLMQRLSDVTAQNEALKQKANEQQEIDRAKEEERDRMKAQLEKSSAKYLESENYHNLIQKQFEMEIAEYQKESESLQQQLEQMEEEDLNEYKTIVNTLQEQNKKLEGKIGSIRNAQKSQMESLQNEKEDLKEMTVALSEEKASLTVQNNTLQSKIAEYVAAEEAARKELADKGTKLQESSQRYNALVETQRSQNEQYERDIEEFKTKTMTLQQQIEGMMEENTKLNSKELLGALQEENEKLNGRLQEYAEAQQTQMDALMTEKEAMQSAATAMEEDNKTLAATVERITAENEKLKEELDGLKNGQCGDLQVALLDPPMFGASENMDGVNLLKKQIDDFEATLNSFADYDLDPQTPLDLASNQTPQRSVRFSPALDSVEENDTLASPTDAIKLDPLKNLTEYQSSQQLQDVIQQSTSDVHAVKKVVMNKYSTVAFAMDDDDEDGYDLPTPQTPMASIEEDSEDDEEVLEEIQRRKTEQQAEIQEAEDREAMLRALNPNMKNDDEDTPTLPFREQSEQKWTELQMKQQKKEMTEMMAQLVADDRMSATLNDEQLKGIQMMSVEQPHADEMEDRVNELQNAAFSVSPTNSNTSNAMKKIVMNKYQTVAFGDDADDDDEDTMNVIQEVPYDDDDDDGDSDHSDSLSETEKAQIAMRKKQQESERELRDEKAAMEEALRGVSVSTRGSALSLHSTKSGHKPQGSGLIKDLDMAQLEFSDDFLSQQKKEMQEQMAHLLQNTPKPPSNGAPEVDAFPSTEVVDEQKEVEVAETKKEASKQLDDE